MKDVYYRDYRIVHNPKPIPDRSNDFDWFPLDYDGPEDPRGGCAISIDAAKQCIDEELLEV
jgi:hypothetical protein